MSEIRQTGDTGTLAAKRCAGRFVTGLAAVAGAAIFAFAPGPLWAQQTAKPAQQNEANQAQTNGAATDLIAPEYRIAPGDTLDVYVVAVPELSRTYRVGVSGDITLPMLDHPIAAEGLTPNELSEAIDGALREQGLISHPDVLVTVDSSPLNSVAVTGSVVKPGTYPVYGETTLIDAVSDAGGLTDDAGGTAIVMRHARTDPLADPASAGNSADAGADPKIIRVPIRRLLDTGDQQDNIPIYPGDSIDVLRAGIIYVVGAVNHAGGFAMTGETNQLTVLQAVALAGNVTHTAVTKQSYIIRADAQSAGGHEQLPVNLKEILAGKAPDQKLVAGDILFVPDSTGKQVLSRVVGVATTLAIYRVPF
jgi:polysaccharide biosynthesis/export protein